MYARCLTCRAPSWVEDAADRAAAAGPCRRCRRAPGEVAGRLARRFGLPADLARGVAERTSTIDEARAALAARPVAATPFQRIVVPLLAFFLAALVIGLHAWLEWNRHLEQTRRLEQPPASRPGKNSLVHSSPAAPLEP